MEAIEIVVYIVIAVLIGGLVLLATGRIGNAGIYDKVKGLFEPDPVSEFSQVDEEALAPLLYQTWEECGLGTREKQVTFQYTGQSAMGAEEIFADVKGARLCMTFSSVSQGCGTREDLALTGPLAPGKVYLARCDPRVARLVIGAQVSCDPAGCAIQGGCYGVGDENPSNACEVCAAGGDTSWTGKADGESCTLGAGAGVCDALSCVECIADGDCPAGEACQPDQTCA